MKQPFAPIALVALVAPVALVAALALTGCGHAYLEHDALSCDRLTDWNDRKACKEKATTAETEWNKRTDAEKTKK